MRQRALKSGRACSSNLNTICLLTYRLYVTVKKRLLWQALTGNNNGVQKLTCNVNEAAEAKSNNNERTFAHTATTNKERERERDDGQKEREREVFNVREPEMQRQSQSKRTEQNINTTTRNRNRQTEEGQKHTSLVVHYNPFILTYVVYTNSQINTIK